MPGVARLTGRKQLNSSPCFLVANALEHKDIVLVIEVMSQANKSIALEAIINTPHRSRQKCLHLGYLQVTEDDLMSTMVHNNSMQSNGAPFWHAAFATPASSRLARSDRSVSRFIYTSLRTIDCLVPTLRHLGAAVDELPKITRETQHIAQLQFSF